MMSDNYTPDDLTQRGLEEMSYERDLAAQTARAETTARQLRDCRDDLKTVIDRAEDTTRHAAALAAEVARLTAERDALRAQLDAAGEGWQRTEKMPRRGPLYEIKAIATNDSREWYIYIGALLVGTVPHSIAIDWRPAPPQE